MWYLSSIGDLLVRIDLQFPHASLARPQDKLFPFHVAFDDELVVEQVGSKLWAMCPHLELNQPLSAHFSLLSPKWPRYALAANIYLYVLLMVVTRPFYSVTAARLRESDDLLFTFQTTMPSGLQITLTGQVQPLMVDCLAFVVSAGDRSMFRIISLMRSTSTCLLQPWYDRHISYSAADYLFERLEAVCLPCDAYFEIFT